MPLIVPEYSRRSYQLLNRSRPMPFVIAHRGASGLLPEHTLEAKALAHGLGADWLEQDLVLTRDNIPIVLHDIFLDTVTDVAEQFPGRQRSDGRYYAIDFELEEIRKLNASERFDHKTGLAVFPNRFPAHVGRFRIPSFEEEIQFIQGLNKSSGRVAGIYPEIKQPAFHEKEGKDITSVTLEILERYGYQTKNDACYLQCFDARTLKRVRNELGCGLRLVQLLEPADCQLELNSPEAMNGLMQKIAIYADGIGPNLLSVLPPQQSSYKRSVLVDAAHQAGLEVHPWTLRKDALPENFATFTDLHQALMQVGVDGVFSDFPGESIQLFQ